MFAHIYLYINSEFFIKKTDVKEEEEEEEEAWDNECPFNSAFKCCYSTTETIHCRWNIF
jgi:hypothetical protein